MRVRPFVQLLLCALAVSQLVRAHAAEVVFDNGASNQEDGWEMTEWFEADDFRLEQRTQVSGVKFWNYARSGGFTGVVTWEIYTNSSNAPGQLLASGTAAPGSHTQTGFVLFGTLYEAVTTFEIVPVMLEPGTYWLALHNGPREYSTRGMFWAPTSKKPSSGAPSHSRATSSNGSWYSNEYPGLSSELAFQVFGSAAPGGNPTPSPSSTPAATATPTPPPQPSPSPSAPPPPAAGQLLNIATRLRVQTGENVLIGGLIVTGNAPKKVIIRGLGPSLSQLFAGALEDTTLELYQGGTLLAANDNWKDSQRQEIEASGIAPADERESAIVYTLDPGLYTAVMSGRSGATGIGVVEVYDLDQAADSKLVNIATRGFIEPGENMMIGGLIVGGSGTAPARVLVRAIGPSLAESGVAGSLEDPVLELRDGQGELVRENDDWEDTQRAAIEATTLAPKYPAESAILVELPVGSYTALVRGHDDAVGVGVVEVYHLR